MQIEEAIKLLEEFKRNGYSMLYIKYGDRNKANLKIEKAIEALTNYIETMQSEFDRLEGIEDNTAMLKMELEKKDTVIDEMANYIATNDSNLCEHLDMTTKCKYYAGENGKTCDECIKQYFYKKVRNNGIKRK